MTKIAIVGGGASGCLCAIELLQNSTNIEVTIFEKNKILATILPTGGGRCNLSNFIEDSIELSKNYPRGEKFLYSVFKRFNVSQTIEYFKKLGIKTYKDTSGKVYPVSNSSKEVREKLLAELIKHKNLKCIKKEITSAHELAEFDYIVIAGGSKGAYELALDFEHTITPLASALCGYITKEKYPSGVAIDIKGEPLLFTHKGISGPYVFKLSSLWAYKEYPFELNVPLFDICALKEEMQKNSKKEFGTILGNFLPKSLVKEILDEKNYHTKCAEISNKLINEIKELNLTVLEPDKVGETVKAGGVNLKEIDNHFNSKICNRLYFIGEILDVDGLCGGFNLQFAWSSAILAARDILKKIS
ncbi:aminoacetone oxidase family FAD-binding enzyme [bacterium]|nr:aminoacetone oxidase family FAD-binding enzyme [bacterium]